MKDLEDVLIVPPIYEMSPDGTLAFHFHEGQQEVMECDARFIFMLAGSQGGKTTVGSCWLYQEVCRRTILPQYYHMLQTGMTPPPEAWMKEGGDFIAGTSDYGLFKMKMLPELLKLFVDTMKVGRYWAGSRVIELRDPREQVFWAKTDKDPMWGRIILRSAQAGKAAKSANSVGVGSWESATAKGAWIDECGQDAFTIDTWDSIKARLAIHRGRVLGTTTLYNHGWLKTQIYDRWKAGASNIAVIQFDSILNPAFPMDEYLEAKATMPEWKFKMRYQGQFDKPAGMIFSDFDESVGIIPPTAIIDTTPIIVGYDPGAVNTASVWLALNKEHNRIILFNEFLDGNISMAEHASLFKHRSAGYAKVRCVGGSRSEKQFRMDMQENKVRIIEPPIVDVEAGLNRIIALMRTDTLRITSNCRNTLAQVREYARKVDAYGEPTPEIDEKSKYHFIDALRYAATLIRMTPKALPDKEKLDRSVREPIPQFGQPQQLQRRYDPKVEDFVTDNDDRPYVPQFG